MSINDTIETYRKRRSRKSPLVIGVIAAILVVIGIVVLVVALSGGNGIHLFSTRTPTPTLTLTPTDTPTITNTPTITPTPTATPSPTPSGPWSYTVQQGDSLTSIVQKENLGDNGMDNIIMLNPDLTPDALTIGQVIILPQPGAALISPTPLPTGMAPGTQIKYLVLEGDSLGLIADKFNSSVGEIETANTNVLSSTNPSLIVPGMYLTIPVNIITPVPATKTPPAITPSATATPSATVTP